MDSPGLLSVSARFITWMCAVHGPSASIAPNMCCIIIARSSLLRCEILWIGLERAGLPSLGENSDALLGERLLRLRSDGPRDPDALVDDLAIAELRKPLGHSQHPLD